MKRLTGKNGIHDDYRHNRSCFCDNRVMLRRRRKGYLAVFLEWERILQPPMSYSIKGKEYIGKERWLRHRSISFFGRWPLNEGHFRATPTATKDCSCMNAKNEQCAKANLDRFSLMQFDFHDSFVVSFDTQCQISVRWRRFQNSTK